MTKIVKNTTGSDIALSDTGVTVPASGQYALNPSENHIWAESIVISPASQLVTLITSGDIVINNGTVDLSAASGIRFLEYPDRISIQEDDVDVTRVNKTLNFEGAVTVQDNGGGKTTVIVATTSEDEDPRLISVECLPSDQACIIDAELLIDDNLCFLKEEDC